MTMSASLRRLNLAVHLTLSIGWLGAVAAFLALAVAGVIHDDARVLRSACVGMGLIASYVILPLALGSFLSGLVSGLGTKWGLFRHYWVLIKLALSAVAILILLKQLDPIEQLAQAAAAADSSVSDLRNGSRRPLIHAAGGLVVLLVVQIFGVYKPRGMTRYGRRQQRRESPISTK